MRVPHSKRTTTPNAHQKFVMNWSAERILEVLDECCDAYTFPMLDNGYVYLAATRLSVFRSEIDWAIVIEVFGFSPRSGLPDIHVHTFGSCLRDRNLPANYVTREAYENYLSQNPNNESRFFFSISEGPWQDADDCELVASNASVVPVRETLVPIPSIAEFNRRRINLENGPRIRTFELCRMLAETHREQLLATPAERLVSVPLELRELLILDEWNHPNVVDENERPSGSETFRQLAKLLESGDLSEYHPSALANTHWRNWPNGGTL
jgi:Family of unknown function (DUF7003)